MLNLNITLNLSKHKKKLSRTRQIFKLPRLTSARVGEEAEDEVGSIMIILFSTSGFSRPESVMTYT